jgi:hypothetical protein
MQNESENSFLYSQGITEFVTISAEFCLFVEKALAVSTWDFLDKSRKILSLLYLKGSLLPKPEYELNEDIETFVTEEDWYFVHDSIQKKLGKNDEYSDVIKSEETGELEIVSMSIAENIADVYQDIKNFVSLMNMGTEEIMKDALAECQINFDEYWGQKSVFALKAIHNLLLESDIVALENKDPDNDPEEKDTSDWFITKRQSDLNNLN